MPKAEPREAWGSSDITGTMPPAPRSLVFGSPTGMRDRPAPWLPHRAGWGHRSPQETGEDCAREEGGRHRNHPSVAECSRPPQVTFPCVHSAPLGGRRGPDPRRHVGKHCSRSARHPQHPGDLHQQIGGRFKSMTQAFPDWLSPGVSICPSIFPPHFHPLITYYSPLPIST